MERLAAAPTPTRLARLAVLRGETSRSYIKNALALALDLPVPPPETVAWCYWRLGEAAFAIGETAERHYRSGLTTFPGYYNAIASMVVSAQRDLSGAMSNTNMPSADPTFVAALGNLYKLAGREKERQRMRSLSRWDISTQ